VLPRLPLHDIHLEAGAVIEAPCGAELPISYGSAAAEHAAARSGAGVVDRSLTGVVEVTGRDRASFLHAMLTNDVKSLEPGMGCAAAFLDAHGKIQSILTVLVLADRILLLMPAGSSQSLLERLDQFLFSEKAYLRDASDEFALFMVLGPAAAELIGRVAGAGPPERAWSHIETTLGATPLRLVRGGGETGETEVWVITPRDEGAAVWQALLAAGARPVGLTALDALRVEAGTPWAGHDADDTVLLPEIPLEKLVSYNKGCYIGQEVVVRVRDRGHVNRLLTGLVLDGTDVPAAGAPVLADGGKAIGRITSAVRSFALERPIALAFVRREHSTPGTVVSVGTDRGPLRGRVTALPFRVGTDERGVG
jgi:folate-binding protein YgfZ